jgi:heterodisulfide reductase subunit A-like polyferredoxin
VAGLNAALTLSTQGFKSVIVEKDQTPGGNANRIHSTPKGENVGQYLEKLKAKVEEDPNVTLVLGAKVDQVESYVGNFATTLTNGKTVKHGVTIIATGAREHKPEEYLYGQNRDPNVISWSWTSSSRPAMPRWPRPTASSSSSAWAAGSPGACTAPRSAAPIPSMRP